ncbi:hypothetical protein COX04_01450 [Candidatus Woesebacteria bacterium CG22_combo_CG10-13_8_21_14_all_45_10]|uniref:DUF7768 domain-containing protein n=1 Tax=Candidatus Woesebacteria bacterium CG22_combo_CG10-13_8_21_14_all_45_10 TaxID=1975060 RepID=A0A2H0BHC2_9BACT|nr:MAG: hypothetical protein COX04_01450 [Candidatus Woesebacteria bacterium CG22_combo_CG10-13_8_21_14_all_45_10]
MTNNRVNKLRFSKKSSSDKIIFTSYSKRNFYLRSDISAFILNAGRTPISPFMNFDYNMAGLVDKNLIRVANNTMLKKSDEIWIFGEISDEVLIEIYLAKRLNKPIHFFKKIDGEKFEEVRQDSVILEDVSSWLWDWVKEDKVLERWHPRLRFKKSYPLVYPAYSKRNFYWQMHISQFCLEKKRVPLNPFMLFRYFLGDSVSREGVYRANSNIVEISDELWIFGEISDGVLDEIKIIKERGGRIKYYKITKSNPVVFRQISAKSAKFEDENLEKYRHLL